MGGKEEAAWSRLLSDIYTAAFDASVRPQMVAAFTRAVGGGSTTSWLVDAATGAPASENTSDLPAEAEQPYVAHYHRIDPWMSRREGMAWNAVTRGSALIDDASLEGSEFHTDYGRRFGMFHVIGTRFPVTDGAGGLFGALAVFRPKAAEAFFDAEVRNLERLLPHVRQSWRLRTQLGAASAAMIAEARDAGILAMLEAIGAPALLMDGQAHLLHANAAAERLDAMCQALRLGHRWPVQAAFADGSSATHRLHQAIADAARGGPGDAFLIMLGSAGSARVTVSPLGGKADDLKVSRRARTGASKERRVLMIIRPLAPAADDATLRQAMSLFGLSRAEAEVALALAAGEAPKRIAATRKVSITTVRTQLLRAQEKTQTTGLRGLTACMATLLQ